MSPVFPFARIRSSQPEEREGSWLPGIGKFGARFGV
jgi:hypothetical protein